MTISIYLGICERNEFKTHTFIVSQRGRWRRDNLERDIVAKFRDLAVAAPARFYAVDGSGASYALRPRLWEHDKAALSFPVAVHVVEGARNDKMHANLLRVHASARVKPRAVLELLCVTSTGLAGLQRVDDIYYTAYLTLAAASRARRALRAYVSAGMLGAIDLVDVREPSDLGPLSEEASLGHAASYEESASRSTAARSLRGFIADGFSSINRPSTMPTSHEVEQEWRATDMSKIPGAGKAFATELDQLSGEALLWGLWYHCALVGVYVAQAYEDFSAVDKAEVNASCTQNSQDKIAVKSKKGTLLLSPSSGVLTAAGNVHDDTLKRLRWLLPLADAAAPELASRRRARDDPGAVRQPPRARRRH